MKQTKTLYSYDSKGRARFWTIEQNGARYRTTSGLVGEPTSEITSDWTVVKGKNIGRSNETSDADQCALAVERKITSKKETKYNENLQVRTEFKPMLADKYNKKKGIEFPVISQPKLDGIRCNLTKDGMVSRAGKPLRSAPHIHQAVLDTGIWDTHPDLVIDGELYNHALRDNFERIVSLCRKSKPTTEDLAESEEVVQYHIYDCFLPSKPDLNWDERMEVLYTVWPFAWNSLQLVDTDTCDNQEELDELYGKYIEDKYEGQMIRTDKAPYQNKRCKDLLKRKEFDDDEFEILDVLEGSGNRSGMAGRIIIKNHFNGGEPSRAGIAGGELLYIKMLAEKGELIGKKATVRYQGLSQKGVPRFPVCIAIRDYEG